MSYSIHNPKLDRALIRDYSNKNLNMSKIAISLLLRLAPFVDRDGRIHLDKEYIRQQLFCDRRTLNDALLELCNSTYKGKKLVTYENGYYVSHFHLFTKGEDSYQKHLLFFNSPEFLNLSKNQTRLFLYVATLNVRNQYTKVAIENLYKNKLHDLRYGMHVYDDYQSLTEDLFHLIDLNLIHVRLPGQSSYIDKSNPNYKGLFHSICGFVNNKKLRTSKYHKNKHVIGLKINPDLYNEKAIQNIASETEIRLLAERYHMYHEDMKADTFDLFTGKKKQLIEKFGLAGLQIYRSSLEKYFKEKNENILYYDLLGKAENHFTDFYLLEEIKKVILAAIKHELGNSRAFSDTGYSFNLTNIPLLVEYFVANSSDEQKVLIDQDIQTIEEAHELMSELSSEEPWTSLQESIDLVYTKHIPLMKQLFEEECAKYGIVRTKSIFKREEQKELIVSLARESLLSQQEEMDKKAKKLKQVVRFYRKKQVPYEMKLKDELPKQETHIRFADVHYNWLEE
ncbi:hypothetical protein NSQ59_15975 [Margalitia sp. FSL K6-0131]|uniref:hypothetical protein n=1 Tax=Margalitia sp. FSL K6-0131 TaxID=2954604 RepID=UPI0030F5AE2A